MSKLFTHVQFLGFEINTTPENQTTYTHTDAWGWHNYDERQTYLGLPNAEQDLTARCKLMEAAIGKAWTASHKLPTTLKLFMAPEFFFRGTKGGYNDMVYVHQIREKLIAMVAASKYSSWLFVFGSIVASSMEVDVVRHAVTNDWIANPKKAGSEEECYNIVYAQPGAAGGTETRMVMKEFRSGIDFVHAEGYEDQGDWMVPNPATNTPGKLVDERTKHLVPARGVGSNRERQRGKYGADSGGGIFDFENLTLGVEICLDHLEERLKNSRPSHGQWEIQIQMIPSAGMNITPASVIASPGGYAFNVDGVRPGCEVKKVTSPAIGATPATLTDVVATKSVPVPKPGNFGRLYVDCTPKIVVFPKCEIPRRKRSA